MLSGRETVVSAADLAFNRLKTFRDVVGSGANPDSPELADAIHAYGTVLRELRHAMRHGEPRLETDISN
ncbi:hypothetical protein [Streptomyces sp. NPDC001816]|uniref:hypothetical protein n=1 Tax=Streptomyces sp. NPDC001816 TaxID=3364612 RepID=UPI0036AE8B13